MIQMTNGSTSFSGKLISDKTGPVSLSPEAEKRLVDAGVAKYVAESVKIAPENPQEPAGGPESTGDMIPPDPGENGVQAVMQGVQAADEPDEDVSAEDELDLSTLTAAQLKELAAEMGVEVKGLRTKAELIAAIEAAKPPNLKVIE